MLERVGPTLGRPYADTLSGSRFANMKKLRCDADGGVWRVAYAFDPDRKAILLVAGNKSGTNQKRFYKDLIATADAALAAPSGRVERKATMTTRLSDAPKELPMERRRIEVEADRLQAEHLTLQKLRKAKDLTQEKLAEILGIRQATVARMEKRSDLLLSTLRSYVEAMGGSLKLLVEFPGCSPIALEGLGDTDAKPSKPRVQKNTRPA